MIVSFTNRIKKPLLFFGSLLLFIFLIELAFRISGVKPLYPSCRIYNSSYYFFFTPNSLCRSKTTEWDVDYSISSRGIRENEYPTPKGEKSYRILILGDSFVEGQGVEKKNTFPEVLENYLHQVSLANVEVIAAGLSAWGTIPEYFFLLKDGLELQPDLVILFLNLTDFADNYHHQKYLTPEGKELLTTSPVYVLRSRSTNKPVPLPVI